MRLVLSLHIILVCLITSGQSQTNSDDERNSSLRRTCHQFEVDQHGTTKRTRMAYSMAVLSALSYCLPSHASSFRVVKKRSINRICRLLCEGRLFLQKFWSFITLRNNIPFRPCPTSAFQKASAKFELKYWFKDWREPTVIPGVRYHDTDLVVASRRDDIILIFSGSASPTDHATNIQTFEKANHAGLFPGNGSLHRGFLNAYSRVNHGLLYSFANDTRGKRNMWQELDLMDTCRIGRPVTRGRYEWIRVTRGSTNTTNGSLNIMVKQRRKGGCILKHIRLRRLLLFAVQDALLSRKRVHIAGHSLGMFFI